MRGNCHSIYFISTLFAAGLCPASAWGVEEDLIFRSFPSPKGFSFEQVRDVDEGDDESIWVSTWGQGVCRIKGTELEVYNESTGFPSNWVRCACADGDGGLWVGTIAGLAHIRGGSVDVYTPPESSGVPSEDISAIHLGRDGRIWVGTNDGYIAVLTRKARGGDEDSSASKYSWVMLAGPDQTRGAIPMFIESDDGVVWASLNDRDAFLREDGSRLKVVEAAEANTAIHGDLFEDAKSRLWTKRGSKVFRFDGKHWIQAHDFGVQVHSVEVSPNGQLWVGTAEGVRTRDSAGKSRGWKTLKLSREIGNPHVTKILFGHAGSVWIGAQQGLYRGAPSAWQEFADPGIATVLTQTVEIHAYHEPIALNHDGWIVRFNGDAWAPIQRPPSAGDVHISWLACPGDGSVWSGLDDGLALIDIGTGEILRKVCFPKGFKPALLYSGSPATILAIGDSGIYEFRDSLWKRLDSNSKAFLETIRAPTVDQDGAYYFCWSRGIDRFHGGEWEALTNRFEVLSEQEFRVSCGMRDGRVWFGTWGAGIFVYDGDRVRQMTTANGLESNWVSHIMEATDGTVWVAYRWHGVASYREGRWVNFGYQFGLPNAPVKRIGEAADGTIWASLEGGRRFRYEPGRNEPETFIDVSPTVIEADEVGIFRVSGRDSWNRTSADHLQYSWRVVPEASSGEGVAWSAYAPETTIVTGRLSPGAYLFEVRASDMDRNVDATPASVTVSVARPFWRRGDFLATTMFLL